MMLSDGEFSFRSNKRPWTEPVVVLSQVNLTWGCLKVGIHWEWHTMQDLTFRPINLRPSYLHPPLKSQGVKQQCRRECFVLSEISLNHLSQLIFATSRPSERFKSPSSFNRVRIVLFSDTIHVDQAYDKNIKINTRSWKWKINKYSQ